MNIIHCSMQGNLNGGFCCYDNGDVIRCNLHEFQESGAVDVW